MNKLPEELRHDPRKLLDDENAEPSMFINDISKLFGRIVAQSFPQEGVSHGFRRIFRILCRNDGITQVELAKASQLSAPSVSAALNKMEAEELVRRVPDEKDRRKVFVYITDKGRSMDESIRSRCREVEKIMMKGIGEDERAALMSTLRKILKNIVEEGEY
ncbi:MAG: MarR family transcriptional regulator [Ruminococcus sp.]|nr:MarR family transcriptional regulator [Ruminococcus sp.]